jgi:hypothetical protein
MSQPVQYSDSEIQSLHQSASKTQTTAGFSVFDAIVSGFDGLIKGIVTQIVSNLGSAKDDIDKGNIGTAFGRMTPSILAGAGTSIGISLLGTKIVGSGIEVLPVAEFFRDLLDVPAIMSAFVSPLLQTSLGIPMQRYALRTFRPMIPNLAQSYDMWRHGQISESDFNQAVANSGFDDSYIPGFKAIMAKIFDPQSALILWRKGKLTDKQFADILFANGWDSEDQGNLVTRMFGALSMMELMRLADYFDLDETFIENNLKASMYSDEQIKWVAPLVKLRPLKDEFTAIASTYKSEYLLGDLDDTEYTKYLSTIGYTSVEASVRLQTAKNLLSLTLLGLKKTMYTYQYEKGVFGTTEPDASITFYGRLVNCGVRNTIANWTVNIERAKKGLPDTEFPPTA